MYPVLSKAFYDSRRTMLWLGIGLAVFALITIGTFPTVQAEAENLNAAMEAVPEELMGLLGGVDVGEFNLGDPVIYLNSQFFIWAVLILGATIIVQALNATINAERNGTLDVMLSLPITRRELLIGRFLNTVITLLVVLTIIYITLIASSFIWEEFALTPVELAGIVYGSLLILIPFTAIAYCLPSFVLSSRGFTGAILYLVFFGMYLLHGLSGLSDVLVDLRPLFLFDYYNANEIVSDGLRLSDVLIMAAVTVIFGGLAYWRIDEKPLGI
jgi:ABC-2 type transport system permease protein